MSLLSYTYTLTNGTVADATQVMGNFTAISAIVNGHIDANNIDQTASYTWTGTNTFSAALLKIKGASTGVASLQYGNTSSSRTFTIPDIGSNATIALEDKDSNIIKNLGLKLSAGALSVTGLGNTALNANTNAAWISYPSSTAGSWLTQQVTADQTLSSGGIKGRWGTTASVAWGSDMPFAVYVTSKDDTATGIRFFIARVPNLKTTPSSVNNIGIDGTAPTTSDQSNIVLFGSTANTGYDSRPCRLIGSGRMTCDNSAGGVWTITALDAGDGIGTLYNFGIRVFTFPQAQNGGGGTAPAAGTHILTNGGTVPQFTTENYYYRLDLNGNCTVIINYTGDGGTDGVGAVSTLFATPFSADSNGFTTATFAQGGAAYVNATGIGSQMCWIGFNNSNGRALLNLFRNNTATSLAQWSHGDFTNGARDISAIFTYPITVP